MKWNSEINGHNGLGSVVPPQKKHVLVYFSQQGQTKEMAMGFYRSYDIAAWKNTKGDLIKNWKVHAWQWIWVKNKV